MKFIRYCPICEKWHDSDNNEFKACPLCNSDIREVKCNRCNHVWTPRKGNYPTICANPRCKSPYYNKERNLEKYPIKE